MASVGIASASSADDESEAGSHGDEEMIPIAFLPPVFRRASMVNDGRATAHDGDADQRLLASIAHELNRTGHPSLCQIELRCEASSITLSGDVSSYFLKQLAQATVLGISGVERVENQLRVSVDSTGVDRVATTVLEGVPVMIRNRPIYHCQHCGAIVRHEPFRVPPLCCGHEMTKAAEETLDDHFTNELEIEPLTSDSKLAPRWPEEEPGRVSV